MGLPRSEHIGRILVDPRDGNRVLVAAEGPLWAAGGERGVYRSTDGGATWTPVLQIDENTGVTDLEFDPANPDVVYAAAYQRRRHVWGFLGGGPGSGIWKSADNGKTWRQVKTGLPSGDMGKIGLAVTPADPSLVYATIEAGEEERGFYRSRDRGESWEKRNGYISGGTGPHYYQEIEASPLDADLVYQMDVFLHVTRDGGATMEILETGHDKHSDNHALWIDPANGNHLLVGHRRRALRELRRGEDLAALPEPAGLAVLQGGAQQPRAVLRHPGRGAGPGHPARPVAHPQPGRHPQPGLVRAARRRRLRRRLRPARSRPPLPDVAGGDALPQGPAQRRGADDPPPARRGGRAGAVELGLAAAGEPAQPRPDLLRLAAGLAERRPGRQLDPDQRRPDGRAEPLRAEVLWAGLERRRAARQQRDVEVRHHHGDLGVAPPRRGRWRSAPTTAWCRSPPTAAGAGAVRRRSPGCRRCRSSTTSRCRCTTPPPSTWRPTTTRPATSRPMSSRAPTWAAPGARWRGTCRKGTIVWALQQDHVRPDLFFLGTERGLYFSLDRGTHWHKLGRRADDPVPRREAAPARQRPGGRHLRPRRLRARRLHAAPRVWRRRRRSRKRACSSRSATPGGSCPTSRDRLRGARSSAPTTSPPRTRPTAPSSPTSCARRRPPRARRGRPARRRCARREPTCPSPASTGCGPKRWRRTRRCC